MIDQQTAGHVQQVRQAPVLPDIGVHNCRPNPIGKLMAAAVLALSLGTTLAIVSSQSPDINLHRALVCFIIAIPAASLYLFLWSAAESRPIYIGAFTRLVAALGMIVGVIGFGFAISSVVTGAGLLFGTVAAACLELAIHAEAKGKKIGTETTSRRRD